MKYNYSTKGTCSSNIEFELDGDIVKNVHFHGGCNGNLKAISTLVEGMTAQQLMEKLSGITCGFKKTSCSDQLAQAVSAALQKEQG
ncbi:MAG: TIGR03905 family TSCPD domain-containing protein [Bacillota bacterium]|nr:TIGR03905 family TSCPD domain-containing protein [Bacillota bacterium]